MRKVKTFLLILVAALFANAGTLNFVVVWPDDAAEDAVFDYVRIGWIEDSSYVPFSADGIYIGYSGASGLQGSSPYVRCVEPIPAGDKYKSGMEIAGLEGLSGFSFYMELYDGTSLVAYSDLADFQTVWDSTNEQGVLARWKPSMTSYVVPEPTSGLLLLLGSALLGLRRKRRVA